MNRNRALPLLSAAWLACLATGCQTVQLKEGSIHQAASYSEIQERQVLDNLAKFVYDINSLPSFSYSDQGLHNVQDTVGVNSTTTWSRIAAGIYGWASSTAVPSVSRQANQNWILKPINDPRKLDLMRCAYQKVVRANLAARGLSESSPCPPCDNGNCPDCAKRLNSFYTGKPNSAPALPGEPNSNGRLTHLCLGTNPVWFAWGCRHDVPKCEKCLHVSHYCGVYVWVLPGGEDELAKLTLAITDFAMNTPAEASKPATKEVTIYLDANGKPAIPALAVQMIKGNVPVDLASSSLIIADLDKKIEQLNNDLKQKMDLADKTANKSTDEYKALNKSIIDLQKSVSDLKQERENLTPIPPTPAPHRPSLDESSSTGILNIQNRLQSVQPPPQP